MDLDRTIRDLLEERKRIDNFIKRLENQQSRSVGKRRGRKPMAEAQRREVSARMKRYWEEKRQAASRGPSPPRAA